MIKKFYALALSLVMVIVLLAGCSSKSKEDEAVSTPDATGTEETSGDTEGDASTGDITAAAEDDSNSGLYATRDAFNIDPEKFKGKTLTIWAWWDIDEDSLAAKDQFEELTGATLEWVNIPWAEYPAKLVSGVSSGTGPDICFFGAEAIPTYINKNIIVPVSDYIDFTKPAFTTYSPQAKKISEYFTVDGKVYALAEGNSSSNKLYYRKDLLENAGLEDPYELYINGEWTWDKWFELMEGVTQDLNGDGVNEVWGFDAWMGVSPFVNTNGTTFIKDGKFNVNAPEFITAIEYYKKLKQPDYVWKPWEEGKDPQSNLSAGNTCFNYWGAYVLGGLREEIGDNLGFVPFPKGPSATADMADVIYPTVTGIAAYSANPELAGLWCEFTRTPESLEAWEAKKVERRDKEIAEAGSEELVELGYAMGDNAVVESAASYPGLSDLVQKIADDSEKTPAQAANENLAAGQAIIDEINNAK